MVSMAPPTRLLCVASVCLAMIWPALEAGQVRKSLRFDGGTVNLVLSEEALSVNVTGLGCSTTVTSTINLSPLAKWITSWRPRGDGLFYTSIALNSSGSTITVHGFGAVKKSQLGWHQYLPYRVEDVRKILHLTARTNMTKEAMKFQRLNIDLPFNESCSWTTQNSSLLVKKSSELTAKEVDLMMAILLGTVSYNPLVKAMEDYVICQLSARYTDMPWVLEKCCGEAEHDIYDSDATYERVECHEPDQLRQTLSYLAVLAGTICFLFSPLLVICVPEDPYQRKKKAAATGGKERTATYLRCCTTATSVEKDQCRVEMQDLKTHTDEVVASIEADTSSLADEEDRIYLNGHLEYTLSVGTVLAYLVYLPPRHHVRNIVYRFLVMAVLRILCGWLWVITDVYYESVVKDNRALMSQGFLHNTILRKIYSEEYTELFKGEKSTAYFARLHLAMIVYIPLVATCFNMLLLYFIVVRPTDICKSLAWEETKQIKANPKKWESVPKSPTGSAAQLYNNLKYRLSRLTTRSFWILWWDDGVCRFSPLFRSGRDFALATKVAIAKQFAYVLLMLPVQVLYVLVHSLPCFAVFNNLYTHPTVMLLSGCCVIGNRHVKLLSLVMTVVMTATGVVLWYWLMLELCWFGAYIIIFLSIDIIRNASSTLSGVIFACSVILYATKASKDFQETYLRLKLDLFNLVKSYSGDYVLKSDGKTLLYMRHRSGCVSTSRCLFEELCQRYHPYRREVFKTLKKLLFTLCCLAVLFAIVLKLQAFSELSTTGEGLLMVATASVPAILGMVKSDTQKALRKAAILQDMRTTIEKMFEPKETDSSE